MLAAQKIPLMPSWRLYLHSELIAPQFALIYLHP